MGRLRDLLGDPPTDRLRVTERPTLAVGVMSGTSLDGVDAALVRFERPDRLRPAPLRLPPVPPRGAERASCAAIDGARAPGLARLHVQLAEWSAEAVETLLAAGPRAGRPIWASSRMHGQTIWHEPPLVSWQLGEPAVLAERFGVRVVSNFRSRDVAAGGQGAPLVPMADVLLFGDPERPRVLLNIGGMANLTYVPAPRDGSRVPSHSIPDRGWHWWMGWPAEVDPGLRFDEGGRLARQGTGGCSDCWPSCCAMTISQHHRPRAPGASASDISLVATHRARGSRRGRGGDRGRADRAEHRRSDRSVGTGHAGGGGIGRWSPSPGAHGAAGGRLAGKGDAALRRFDELFFDGDAKEAVAFALLGYLAVHGQPGNLPAATGARGHRVLGQVTPA